MTKKQAAKVFKAYRDGRTATRIDFAEAIDTAIRLLSKQAKRRAKK